MEQQIIGYEDHDKDTGELAGTFSLDYKVHETSGKIYQETESKEGIEAIYIDFFTNTDDRESIQHKFSGSKGKVVSISISPYQYPFEAKLAFSRFKDIWDYNRFVPNRNIKSTQKTESPLTCLDGAI